MKSLEYFQMREAHVPGMAPYLTGISFRTDRAQLPLASSALCNGNQASASWLPTATVIRLTCFLGALAIRKTFQWLLCLTCCDVVIAECSIKMPKTLR